MIVVNLRQSMGRLVEQVQRGLADEEILRQLQHDTTNEWAGLSKEVLGPDSASRDYLVGAYHSQVVSIFHITGWHAGEQPGRVVFDVEPAVEMAGAVGQPVPGGPWKRGEARPVRYADTGVFVRELADRGVLDTFDDAGGDAVERRMVEVVRDLASPTPTATGRHAPLDGVEVERDPRGGVRVTVPMGTKVTVVQREP